MKFTPLQIKIFEAHEADPEKSARALASELDCHHSYVATTILGLERWRAAREREERAARRFSWVRAFFEQAWRIDPADRVVAWALAAVLDARTDSVTDDEDGPGPAERSRASTDAISSVVWGSAVESWPEIVALAKLWCGELSAAEAKCLPREVRAAIAAEAAKQRAEDPTEVAGGTAQG